MAKQRRHKAIGKPRGAVLREDWYLVEDGLMDGHVEPVGPWFDAFGPESRRTHVQGWAVRMPDGHWHHVGTRREGEKLYRQAMRLADARYTWAENIEARVRQAFKKERPKRMTVRLIDESVASSYLYPANQTGWVKPDPFVVLVFTEHGIGDPFYYEDVHELFGRVADDIEADPWYEGAYWDSIGAGLAAFYVTPEVVA